MMVGELYDFDECNDFKQFSRKVCRYLNPFCTEKCVNNLIEGKLQCNCGNSGLYNWAWEKQEDTCARLTSDRLEITFHPVYSSGTAAIKGTEPFKTNQHHFWEMKVLSQLYGTDVMIGVGTSEISLEGWRHRFFSLLGHDKNSWGYSYNGLLQHDNTMSCYGAKFGLGSLVGVHLDMCSGTLEYYLNRRPLGIAFKGLKSHKLFPMISSTAAQSAMKMTCAMSFSASLQLTCLQCIVRHPQLYNQLKTIPGLAKIYEQRFFWMMPKEYDDIKRKSSNKEQWSTNKRKMFQPTPWPTFSAPDAQKICIHFVKNE